MSEQRAKPVVVVADDDADIRALAGLKLRLAGFEVLEAADGQAALDLIREQIPDAVVLDVVMPHLDGLTVLGLLKADAGTSGIPVLLTSAHARRAEVEQGLQAGAAGYLTKPFSPAALVTAVREAAGID